MQIISNTIPNGTLLDFFTTSGTLLPKFNQKKTLSILSLEFWLLVIFCLILLRFWKPIDLPNEERLPRVYL